ncbi:MAG: ABC transporter substrate-binding protein [Planctomycetota bacterium]|nr:ABC transporter substrate-binding protein [Planctomycetota bacterium]
MRIVSLLPSATEMLCLIGGRDLLVGRSHECDFPKDVLSVPALTGQLIDPGAAPAEIDRQVSEALSSGRSLYHLDAARLQALKPDLIVTQDLCEVCSIDLASVRAAAARIDPPPTVLALNPISVEGVFDDLLTLGRATGLEERARTALVRLRERFFAASDYVNSFAHRPSVAFLEWTDPLFAPGHWTPQLIERAGAAHPLNPTEALPGAGAGAGGQMAHRVAGKSRRVTADEVVASAPEFLIVCPCGVGLAQIPAHLALIEREPWFRELPAVRAGRVALVDGNHMFNRPGPRLVDAYLFLVGWINDRPELIPDEFPWMPAVRH